MNKTSQSGQSLIELVIGIAIGVLFITGALGIITVTLRLDLQNKYGQPAAELAQEITEQVAVVANADWHSIDADTLVHGTSTFYHIEIVDGFLAVAAGNTTIALNDQTYTAFFIIEDVYRDTDEMITDNPESGITDPSTLKISATVQWTDKGDLNETVFTRYLTRNRDRIATQGDWSGGAVLPGASETPVTNFGLKFSTSTGIDYSVPGQIIIDNTATTSPTGPYSNIDPTIPNFYAWSDVTGWIDFRITNTVYVTSTELTGFATSSQIGFIALNCNSVPPSATNVCPSNGGSSQFGVLNDGAGNLSGFAWNDNVGWISFKDTVNPLNPGYQVTIDQNTGDFHGFAWNDTTGWISFNCVDTPAGCGGGSYKVKVASGLPTEATLVSLIYNTTQTLGVAPNSLVWQGIQPPGTMVRFQIATDCINPANTAPNCDGIDDWNFVGDDDSPFSYFDVAPDTSIKIPRTLLNNKQYLRYKAFLYTDPDRLVSPTVNDITINWSL